VNQDTAVEAQERRKRDSYVRVYRLFNFGSIAFVVLVFSVMLSRSLGWVGLVLPSLVIASMYAAVTLVLDAVIYVVELRNGAAGSRRQRK
jgi:hypothetical protein